MFVDRRVFENDEANELFEFLDTLDVEYRKPRKDTGRSRRPSVRILNAVGSFGLLHHQIHIVDWRHNTSCANQCTQQWWRWKKCMARVQLRDEG